MKNSKICKKCKIDKAIEEYGGFNYLDQICIQCKHPTKLPKNKNEKCIICNFGKKQHNENICCSCASFYSYYKRKQYLTSLLGGKCESCGLENIICLDFDHINPSEKLFTIGQSGKKTLQEIEKEVLKCRLLCANCHRLRHSAFDQKILDYFDRPIDTVRKRITETGCEYIPRSKYRKVERPSREELEKLIWQKPTSELAKEFGVSDNAIGKWCKYYEISKPPRGYWMKKRSKIMQNSITYEPKLE